ncbi:MAG: adenylate/guanylate cyclase domain-containing protein [Spirochaetota bacterium]
MKGSPNRIRFGIGFRIDALILLALALGLGIVFTVFVSTLVSTRDRLTETSLLRQADIMYASIENFMLPGEAPIAVKFVSQLKAQSPDADIRLWRRSGEPAFSDNATITRVNGILGKGKFLPRPEPRSPIVPTPPLRFSEAVDLPPNDVAYREDSGDRSYYRVYRPLINLPKCTVCHGSDHTIRGVIDLRSDISELVKTENLTILAGGGGFVAVVTLLALVLGSFLRRVIIDPVTAIGRLCADVAGGRFEGRVAVGNKDEIGELAQTVNTMVVGLRERFELTKYVSSGTIGAISGGEEPRRVTRSILFSDVRGFTAYSSDRDPEKVVAVLNRILEVQTRIIRDEGGDVDKFVGDEIVAVFAGEDAARRACRAALAIRARIDRPDGEFDGLRVGIGIATGPVIQGMVGSSERADFTVIGDSANMGSRLCALAKQGDVVVSEGTRKLCPELKFRGPYAAKVKGKSDSQKVWFLEDGKS